MWQQELETWLFTLGTNHLAAPGAAVFTVLSQVGMALVRQSRRPGGAGCSNRGLGDFPGPFLKTKGKPQGRGQESQPWALEQLRLPWSREEVWPPVAPAVMKK